MKWGNRLARPVSSSGFGLLRLPPAPSGSRKVLEVDVLGEATEHLLDCADRLLAGRLIIRSNRELLREKVDFGRRSMNPVFNRNRVSPPIGRDGIEDRRRQGEIERGAQFVHLVTARLLAVFESRQKPDRGESC